MNNRTINGKILYISKKTIYIAKSYKIYISYDYGNTWSLWTKIPVKFLDKLIMSIPLLSRLFRKSVHHLIADDDNGIIVANKSTFIVKNKSTKLIEPLYGSRPMALCQTNINDIFYGEYRSNTERSDISVWKLDKTNLCWKSVWTFNTIRHIHGVYYDKYTNSIWVTTGDSNDEAGIYVTYDNFQTLDKISGGSQQFRTVQLLFSETHIYFGSDAPEEINYIYRMKRDGTDLEQLQKVGSSVFYGTKIHNSFFFSTAIEPSNCNKTHNAEIWRSDDGQKWYKFKELKKDIWSMKYFQYGQIMFPNYDGDTNLLSYYPFATKDSGKSILKDLKK